MGLFDSVYISCLKCDYRIELQSKGGPCELKKYDEYVVPIDVAGDIQKTVFCDKCKTKYKVLIEPDVVRVRLTKYSELDELLP